MDFGFIYTTLWSIGAIILGIFILVFPERMISNNVNGFLKLYKWSGLDIFKKMAEGFDTTSQRMVNILVAIMFIATGLYNIVYLNFWGM